MTISISKLKADRTGMHKPENWRHDESQRRFIEISGSIFHLDDSANARGLVATVKVADVLIEIAATALALSAAGEAFASCKWPKGSEFRRRLEIAAIEAERVHLEALAKVSP